MNATKSATLFNPFNLISGTAFVFLISPTILHATDWPQWRGPARDGVSQEKGLLKEWPANGPKLLWQVKDIGAGFSTPAVVGDRLYVRNAQEAACFQLTLAEPKMVPNTAAQ